MLEESASGGRESVNSSGVSVKIRDEGFGARRNIAPRTMMPF